MPRYPHKLYYTVIIFYFLAESDAKNVAFKKSGTFCNKAVSNKIFDGDLNYKQSVFMEDCGLSFMIVNLRKAYSIQYVVVYHGEKSGEALDYFIVQLTVDANTETCGLYLGISLPIGQGMRINCLDINKLFTHVKLELQQPRALDLAEIEVHSFALESDTYVLLYQGCYGIVEGQSHRMSWKDCQRKCFDENYIFAAIKANSLCSCTNAIAERFVLDDTQCQIACEGERRYCGGENGFSIYMIKPPLPHYEECYHHEGNHSGVVLFIPLDTCIDWCQNWTYFGLKLGDRCLCMNAIPESNVTHYTYCAKQKCLKDEIRFCGGWNGMATYRTCVRDNSMGCLDIMRCKDKIGMFGVCKSGCKEGFLGEHCLEKVSDFPDLPTTTQVETEDNRSADGGTSESAVMKQMKNGLYLFLAIFGLYCMACLFCVQEESGGDSASVPVTASS